MSTPVKRPGGDLGTDTSPTKKFSPRKLDRPLVSSVIQGSNNMYDGGADYSKDWSNSQGNSSSSQVARKPTVKSPTKKFSPQKLNGPLVGSLMTGANNKADYSKGWTSSQGVSSSSGVGNMQTNTSPTKTFSPRKLDRPLVSSVIQGSNNMYDGGADYSKGWSNSQGNSSFSQVARKETVTSPTKKFSPQKLNGPLVSSLMTGANNKADYSKGWTSCQGVASSSRMGSMQTNTSPTKTFSPRKLDRPLVSSVIQGSNNMYDGGADYSKGWSNSQGMSSSSQVTRKETVTSPTKKFSPQKLNEPLVGYSMQGANNKADYSKELSSAQGVASSTCVGSMQTNTSPTKTFSPRKLDRPLVSSVMKGSNNMYDGGADYSKGWSNSQGNSSSSQVARKETVRSPTEKFSPQNLNEPLVNSLMTGANNKADYSKELSSAQGVASSSCVGSMQTNTSPTKTFSPQKLDRPLVSSVIQGSNNMYDGGADYSKGWSSSQGTSDSSQRPRTNSQDSFSSNASTVDMSYTEADMNSLLEDMDNDPMEEELLTCSPPTTLHSTITNQRLTSHIQPPTCGPGLRSDSTAFDHQEAAADPFTVLPLELMENILCRLPMLDLNIHVKRVCRRWNEIISEPKFLQWKKTYHQLLRGCPGIRDHVKTKLKLGGCNNEKKNQMKRLLKSGGLDLKDKASLLPGMIQRVKGVHARNVNKMTTCLQRHPKYTWADALIKERLPDCVTDHVADPWCVIAAIIVLSDSVHDILLMVEELLGRDSDTLVSEVIECLYCIASQLLLYKLTHYEDVWTRLHYRLFYALYLFENNSVKVDDNHPAYGSTMCVPAPPQQDRAYTQEQMRICNQDVNWGSVMKIIAYAGTGKTTTLIRYTQLRPHTRFLLLVFNSGVRKDCAKRFPAANVTCMTFHALARGSYIGHRYSHKIINGSFYNSTVRGVLKARKGLTIYEQAKFVILILETFMASADEEITMDHVCADVKAAAYLHQQLVEDARTIWRKAVDINNKQVRLPHDGYLKVYQLAKPAVDSYDAILIDEAQDITPAIVDILQQQQAPLILVGDPNQSIYSFRGAVNGMERISANLTFYLTQSFRFGENIAFLANTCLEILRGERKKILVGNSYQDTLCGEQRGQLAYLSRKNMTQFEEAVRLAERNDVESIAIIGGIGEDNKGGYYGGQIEQIRLLKVGRCSEITDKYIGKFKNIFDLENFAKKTGDQEMLGKIRIVNKYPNLEQILAKIREKCVDDPQDADVVLSTAHKAKGLEFSTVRIADDFWPDFGPGVPGVAQVPNGGEKDEYNLLYVAVTRAKKSVQLTPPLMRLLKMAGERFGSPKLTTDNSERSCVLTGRVYVPTAITLHRCSVKLAVRHSLTAGTYSPQTVTEDFPSLAHLYGALKDSRTNKDVKTPRVSADPAWDPRVYNADHVAYAVRGNLAQVLAFMF